ncbi:MAG: hypothetical protein AAF721_24295 [Myxococcota bacterium]
MTIVERRIAFASLCLCCAVACGDDGTPSGDGSGGSTTASAGERTTSSGAAADTNTPGDAADSTGVPPGDSSSGGGTTGDPTTSGTTSSDTTAAGSTTTGEPDASVYGAQALPGGLDRVIVTRANEAEMTCTRMVLTAPLRQDEFDIDLPDPWRVESVVLFESTTDCPDGAGPDATITDGTGTIEFLELDGLALYPCAIGLDLSLTVPGMPGAPQVWSAASVDVAGTNCN